LADIKWEKAEYYRQRAKELIEQSHAAKDEATKRTRLELANAWLELARRAEELENRGNK
jgi:hypothetical protein